MKVRFSLLWLMALVLLVAVGFAALGNPTGLWASALFTLAVFLLCVAVLGAVFRHGRRRAFWVGFATFGLAYLVLTFVSAGLSPPPLLTTELLAYMDRLMNNPFIITIDGTFAAPSPRGIPITGPSSVAFHQVGHSLAALVFALVGSVVARNFAAREEG